MSPELAMGFLPPTPCSQQVGADMGREQIKSLCFLLLVSGRALVRGPSSLMKKAELSADQAPDANTEDSSTSLAPTLLYLSTYEAAPATEESLILPVTSLWPQVRGPGWPQMVSCKSFLVHLG